MRPINLLVWSALSLGNISPNMISVLQMILSSILIDNILLAQHGPRFDEAWKMPFEDFALERRIPFKSSLDGQRRALMRRPAKPST